MSPLRRAAIRRGLVVPHPIPCNLVKDERGVWVESPWINRHLGGNN